MIGHKRPRKAVHFPPFEVGANPFEKNHPIAIICECFPLLDPAGVNVVDRAGEVYSWATWHAPIPGNFQAEKFL